MTLLGWLRHVRVEVFSTSEHWADVMAEADALQSEHDGMASEVAVREELKARGAEARSLFRDVSYVLKARAEHEAAEVSPPEPQKPEPSA